MQITALLQVLAFVGLASAAPTNAPLQWDDVLLVGRDGETKLVKDHEYRDLMRRGLLEPTAPPMPDRRSPLIAERSTAADSSTSSNTKRCDESTEVQIISDTKFTGWDVPMSPVVGSKGGQVMVAVSSGYSLANSLGVTAAAEGTIEAVLTLRLSVAFTTTWTTTETSTFSYMLPEQNYGLVVSQPMTRRFEGNYLSGCTDSPTVEAFTSDTFSSESYGELSWVSGVIRLCNSTVYPVPFCNGDGEHS